MFPKNEQTLVVNEVDLQLSQQPNTPTRKRKVLRPNPIAPWVLRLGDIRVFYDVEVPLDEASTVVTVKAVGRKVHNELWIGGEKVVI